MMALHEQSTGIPLQQLLAGLTDENINTDLSVNGISTDSRMTELGDLFMACKGMRSHGVDYINDAIEAGACAVAIEQGLICPDKINVPVYIVPCLARKVGIIASRFYQHPSKALSLIAITGTNGKTSVSWWLAQLYARLSAQPCGLIGTLGAGKFPDLDITAHTTPDAITLHKYLAQFAAENVKAAFMEASSHALVQGRTAGLKIDTGVFTNLSHEHLDYHGDLESYRESKASLFRHEGMRCAVINLDDATGRLFAEMLAAELDMITYAASPAAATVKAAEQHLQARIESINDDFYHVWLSGAFGKIDFMTKIKGTFNISNLLAVTAVLLRLGFRLVDIVPALEGLQAVPGRLEEFTTDAGAKVYVDYAHTPDALGQVLSTLKRRCKGRLICVFGCGGDRDNSKRPKMGAVVSQLADEIIITDDNPRHEPPEKIVQDILSGIPLPDAVVIEHNRSKAITQAIAMATGNDIVLIAGKGHETWQEIKNKRYPFSDRQQVRNCIEGRQ